MSLPTQTSSPQVSAWRPTGASNYSEEDDALQDQEVVPIAEQLVTPLASASLIEDTSMNIVSLIQYIWTTDMVRKYSSSVSHSTMIFDILPQISLIIERKGFWVYKRSIRTSFYRDLELNDRGRILGCRAHVFGD